MIKLEKLRYCWIDSPCTSPFNHGESVQQYLGEFDFIFITLLRTKRNEGRVEVVCDIYGKYRKSIGFPVKCTIWGLGPTYSRSEYCTQYNIWCTDWPNEKPADTPVDCTRRRSRYLNLDNQSIPHSVSGHAPKFMSKITFYCYFWVCWP